MQGAPNYLKYVTKNQQACYPQNDASPFSMNLLNTIPKNYHFLGNSLSLQSRLEAITDQKANQFVDATITVEGVLVQEYNKTSVCCLVIWGSLTILPLLLICCDAWKRCTYAAYDVPVDVYQSLGKLLRGQNLRNLTLTVTDNCFDLSKAQILFNLISQSNLKGFTFINLAGEYDFKGRQYSQFHENMKPIKSLTKVITDIRWINNQRALKSTL